MNEGVNELQRAVALVRVRVLHRDVVLCVSQASLRVSCGCFVVGALRGSHTEGLQLLPDYPTQRHSREDGRGGGGLEKRGLCAPRVL